MSLVNLPRTYVLMNLLNEDLAFKKYFVVTTHLKVGIRFFLNMLFWYRVYISE